MDEFRDEDWYQCCECGWVGTDPIFNSNREDDEIACPLCNGICIPEEFDGDE